MRLAVDGDLMLFHRFEQRGLGLWARAVDLVCEKDLRKDRSGPELEVADFLVEGADPGHVRRQQVGSELDAAERAVKGACERLGEHRLAHAWDVLDQEVSFAEEGDEAEPDLVFLVDDRASDVGHDSIGDPGDDVRRQAPRPSPSSRL